MPRGTPWAEAPSRTDVRTSFEFTTSPGGEAVRRNRLPPHSGDPGAAAGWSSVVAASVSKDRREGRGVVRSWERSTSAAHATASGAATGSRRIGMAAHTPTTGRGSMGETATGRSRHDRPSRPQPPGRVGAQEVAERHARLRGGAGPAHRRLRLDQVRRTEGRAREGLRTRGAPRRWPPRRAGARRRARPPRRSTRRGRAAGGPRRAGSTYGPRAGRVA